MKIGDEGRYYFEFSAVERERLIFAGDVLADLYNVMKDKHYDTLITGYPEDEKVLMADDIGELSRQLNEIARAWAIE